MKIPSTRLFARTAPAVRFRTSAVNHVTVIHITKLPVSWVRSWVDWQVRITPTSPRVSPERLHVRLDPSAFLADPDLLKALEKHESPIACDEERVLFHQGDPPVGLYILRRGEATLSMDSGDNQQIFSCRAIAGSLLGLPALIGNQPYSLSATASRGAQVAFVDKDTFGAIMQTELPLMVKILQVLAAEVRSARMAITQL